MFFTKVLLAISFLVVSAAAFAGEQERYALVFGNAAYDGGAALANSVHDATDMANALGSIGWKVTRLLDGDRAAMARTLLEFKAVLAQADHPLALLYYAGHGIQIGGVNYLIPVHQAFETANDVLNDALSLESILATFDDAKVGTEIVILDACRDNPFGKKGTRSVGGSRGLSVVSHESSVQGSAILFATAPGETAADGTGGNGVFTAALLQFLPQDLKLQDLATQVTKKVRELTAGKQSPYSSMSLPDDLYLVPASMRASSGAADPEKARLERVAALQYERASLGRKKERLLGPSKEFAWLWTAGAVAAGVGAGLAGFSLWQGPAAVANYQAAEVQPTSQTAFDNARGQAQLANVLVNVGLGSLVVGTAALAWIALLTPPTDVLDRELVQLDASLAGLGSR